jgi:hypothetical protein
MKWSHLEFESVRLYCDFGAENPGFCVKLYCHCTDQTTIGQTLLAVCPIVSIVQISVPKNKA